MTRGFKLAATLGEFDVYPGLDSLPVRHRRYETTLASHSSFSRSRWGKEIHPIFFNGTENRPPTEILKIGLTAHGNDLPLRPNNVESYFDTYYLRAKIYKNCQ